MPIGQGTVLNFGPSTWLEGTFLTLYVFVLRSQKKADPSERFSCVSLCYLLRDTREPSTWVCSPQLIAVYRLCANVINQTALVTLLERKHLEHTLTVFGVPLSSTLIFFTLGFQNLLVLLTEWLTLLPNTVSLLQISHFAIYITPPLDWSSLFPQSNNYFNTLIPISARFF